PFKNLIHPLIQRINPLNLSSQRRYPLVGSILKRADARYVVVKPGAEGSESSAGGVDLRADPVCDVLCRTKPTRMRIETPLGITHPRTKRGDPILSRTDPRRMRVKPTLSRAKPRCVRIETALRIRHAPHVSEQRAHIPHRPAITQPEPLPRADITKRRHHGS